MRWMDGHVHRNIRVALQAADVLEPYATWVRYPGDARTDAAPTDARVCWRIGGAYHVTDTQLLWWNRSVGVDAEATGVRSLQVDAVPRTLAEAERLATSTRWSQRPPGGRAFCVSLAEMTAEASTDTVWLRVRLRADAHWGLEPEAALGALPAHQRPLSHVARGRTDPQWYFVVDSPRARQHPAAVVRGRSAIYGEALFVDGRHERATTTAAALVFPVAQAGVGRGRFPLGTGHVSGAPLHRADSVALSARPRSASGGGVARGARLVAAGADRSDHSPLPPTDARPLGHAAAGRCAGHIRSGDVFLRAHPLADQRLAQVDEQALLYRLELKRMGVVTARAYRRDAAAAAVAVPSSPVPSTTLLLLLLLQRHSPDPRVCLDAPPRITRLPRLLPRCIDAVPMDVFRPGMRDEGADERRACPVPRVTVAAGCFALSTLQRGERWSATNVRTVRASHWESAGASHQRPGESAVASF
eukprot:ctg_289.g179